MDLASHLGGMTLDEMLDRMTAAELGEWRALYRREPWGGRRLDILFSRLAAQIVGAILASAGARAQTSSADYEPDWWAEAKRAQDAADVFRQFKAFAGRHNERVRKRGRV